MLAADAELEARYRGSPSLGRQCDQLAHPFLVDADEGVAGVDALFDIFGEEAAGIVAADAQCGLCEVVGAEAEELRFLGDAPRLERGAGQLEHRADEIVDGLPLPSTEERREGKGGVRRGRTRG